MLAQRMTDGVAFTHAYAQAEPTTTFPAVEGPEE